MCGCVVVWCEWHSSALCFQSDGGGTVSGMHVTPSPTPTCGPRLARRWRCRRRRVLHIKMVLCRELGVGLGSCRLLHARQLLHRIRLQERDELGVVSSQPIHSLPKRHRGEQVTSIADKPRFSAGAVMAATATQFSLRTVIDPTFFDTNDTDDSSRATAVNDCSEQCSSSNIPIVSPGHVRVTANRRRPPTLLSPPSAISPATTQGRREKER